MTVPDGWNAFFIDNPGRKKVPWDLRNETGIVAPEFKPVDKKPPYLDPPRGHWSAGGQWAMCWFAFWKVMDAGLWQQVQVTPGQKLSFTAWAHGWSNTGNGESSPHPNDPKWSDGGGVGYNAFFQLADPVWPDRGQSTLDDTARNMVFQVGIDPTGGTNAWASTVVWGPGAHIYNVFQKVPSAEAVAQSDKVTVFMRCKNLWGFMHVDAYWDDPALEVIEGVLETPTPRPPVTPKPVTPTPVTPVPITPSPPASDIPRYEVPLNKSGLHIVVQGSHNGYEDYLRCCADAGRPAGLIKVMKDGGAAQLAKQFSPKTYTVWRWFGGKEQEDDTPPGNWQWAAADSKKTALKWMSTFYGMWEVDRQWVDFYEFLNEPDPADRYGMERAAELVMYCMEDAEAHGFKTAIWSFTAGLPRSPSILPGDFAQAELLLETLKWAAEHGHVFSVHDGSVNDERRLFREAYEDKTALRYRFVKKLMDQKGWPMPYVVITEAYQVDGYRKPDWEDWKWYLTELAKDDYVLGCAWFTLGDYEFSPGHSVNVAAQLSGLAELASTMPLPTLVPSVPPTTPPTTPPPPTLMAVQPTVTPYGGLKLRNARNVEANFVEALPSGATITVLEGPVMDGGEQWVRVRSASGGEGWARIASAGGEVYLAKA
jgi:hypothetical protein